MSAEFNDGVEKAAQRVEALSRDEFSSVVDREKIPAVRSALTFAASFVRKLKRPEGEPADLTKAACERVMHVLSEYEFDLDSDIEGCDADELRDIESQFKAVQQLRKRIRGHLIEGADPRGTNPPRPAPPPVMTEQELERHADALYRYIEITVKYERQKPVVELELAVKGALEAALGRVASVFWHRGNKAAQENVR